MQALESLLSRLDQQSTASDGASCITLLIPADYNRERLSAFLTQETASAQNIKDKTNRKSVVAAFARIKT